jgi:hypothetical protein
MAEQIEKKEQFTDDPVGWAKRWAVEFAGARKALESWRERGRKVVDRYLDERADNSGTRLNLFHGDVETKKALLYGNTPRVRSRRRFADADDDEARVSAEMQERMLNTDIERDEDGFETALEMARDDRLLPGLGVIRMRYVAEFEDVPEQPAQMDDAGNELAPAVPAGQRKKFEDVETDYVHWEDYLWSPCRYWGEVRWEAFGADMTRAELHKRFDATIAEGDAEAGPRFIDTIPLNAKAKDRDKDKGEDPWARARVWEVWTKDGRGGKKGVFWVVEEFDRILDWKEDPLGLVGFWPNPRPMMANVTSKKLVPVPDFVISQDLYDEIDKLSAKIQLLEDAIRVTGVYDQTQPEIAQILQQTGVNKLYPASNMAALIEKGGMEKVIAWFPLEQIIKAIEVLTAKRNEKIQLLFQVNGMSDIMRGQQTEKSTATESRIKARFGSTRMQAAQKEFARFAAEAQKVRAEIIAKWFDPETIIERSNILRTPDAPLAPKAAQLIKDEHKQYRIEIAAEGLGMTDFDALKQERTEFLKAVSGFMKEIAAIAPAAPQAVPFLLKFLKYGIAGFQGAAELEGVLDEMVNAADKAAQQAQMAAMAPKPPDPKVEAEKVKAGAAAQKAQADIQKVGMDMQATRMEHGARMQEIQAEMVQDRERTRNDVTRSQAAPPGVEFDG